MSGADGGAGQRGPESVPGVPSQRRGPSGRNGPDAADEHVRAERDRGGSELAERLVVALRRGG